MEEAQADLSPHRGRGTRLKTIFANFKNRLETIPTKYASTMAQLTDPAEATIFCKKQCRKHLWN
jgi:hypothetical protein